jgi:hypothetical protein
VSLRGFWAQRFKLAGFGYSLSMAGQALVVSGVVVKIKTTFFKIS